MCAPSLVDQVTGKLNLSSGKGKSSTGMITGISGATNAPLPKAAGGGWKSSRRAMTPGAFAAMDFGIPTAPPMGT